MRAINRQNMLIRRKILVSPSQLDALIDFSYDLHEGYGLSINDYTPSLNSLGVVKYYRVSFYVEKHKTQRDIVQTLKWCGIF